MDQLCFQLKASFSPCTILQILRNDLESFETQINEKIKQAPQFFQGLPILIELEKINDQSNLDFLKIKNILQSLGLIPLGIRGGNEEHISAASAAGLPSLQIGKNISEPKQKIDAAPASTAKLITQPVRSGMQCYAKNSDLIITAQVSPGAELMADGNIHVYGVLHGRALAGVQGNKEASIFCQNLEAELVAIAGFYLTKEELQKLRPEAGPFQIYLKDEKIVLKKL